MVWQVTVCKGVLYELFWLPCRWLVNELDGHAVDGRYILLPHGAARSRSADHAVMMLITQFYVQVIHILVHNLTMFS